MIANAGRFSSITNSLVCGFIAGANLNHDKINKQFAFDKVVTAQILQQLTAKSYYIFVHFYTHNIPARIREESAHNKASHFTARLSNATSSRTGRLCPHLHIDSVML